MRLTIRTDGGSRGNPGPAAAGVVITDPHGRAVFAQGFYLGRATNNVAEYEALLRGLAQAAQLGATQVELFCDSELVVRQVNGQYKVKNPSLRLLYQQVIEQMRDFESVAVRHVRREQNTQADALVNAALDARADYAQANPAPSGPVESAFLQTAQLDQIPPSASGRTTLAQQQDLVTEHICLPPGQNCRIPAHWSQATVTVLRGRGAVSAGSCEQPLTAGSWLRLGPTTDLDFAAEGDEPLVVVLTAQC